MWWRETHIHTTRRIFDFMKKTTMAVMLAACAALSGCGSADTDTVDTAVKQEDGSWKAAGGTLTLGEYTGMEFTKTVTQATDAEILAEAESYVEAYADDVEVTDRGCTRGDTVTLSIAATEDGEENTALSADSIELEFAGDDMESIYGSTFYAQLEGASTGDTVTFAMDGVDYEVSILSITVPYTDGLTDDFVSDYFGFDTVDEFLVQVAEYINEEYEEQAEDDLETAIYAAVRENCTDVSVSKSKLKENVESLESSYSSYVDLLGMEDVSEVYELFGVSEDDITSDAKDSLIDYMVTLCIAADQGLGATDEDTDTLIAEIVDYAGYDSEEDLLEDYAREKIQYWATAEKVTEFLVENNTVTTEYVSSGITEEDTAAYSETE
jgi:trigger factor